MTRGFRVLCLCAMLLLFRAPADAVSQDHPVPLLGITDLRTVNDDSSQAEARAFSEFIRKEIEGTGMYRVLSHSSMQAILKARKFPQPCFELPCFSSMGKLLGADQILAGHLKQSDGGLEITLRLIDVKKTQFLTTMFREAADVTTQQLFGAWGRSVIFETIGYVEEAESEMGGAQSGDTIAERIAAIPDRIKNRYAGMVYIPAGETTVGSLDGDVSERPPRRVFVDAFYIGKLEVTNEEYARFVQASGHGAPPHWTGGVVPFGMEKHPATWISYEDAEAYCAWAQARLPSEAEWIRAARAETTRVYPWGDSFEGDYANTWEAGRNGTAPVGSFFRGASLFGVEDMAGNGFEWVSGFFEPYPGAREKLLQYDQHLRVLKGGSWTFNSYYARIAHRFARSGGEQGRSYGFRVARDR